MLWLFTFLLMKIWVVFFSGAVTNRIPVNIYIKLLIDLMKSYFPFLSYSEESKISLGGQFCFPSLGPNSCSSSLHFPSHHGGDSRCRGQALAILRTYPGLCPLLLVIYAAQNLVSQSRFLYRKLGNESTK